MYHEQGAQLNNRHVKTGQGKFENLMHISNVVIAGLIVGNLKSAELNLMLVSTWIVSDM